MDRSDLTHTVDGIEIVPGLRVMNNDLRWGTVVKLNADGWHDVMVDGSEYVDHFNGERLTTVDRIRNLPDPKA